MENRTSKVLIELVADWLRKQNLKESSLQEIASDYPDPEEVLKAYRQNSDAMRQIESIVLEEQVVDYLLERAKVADQPATFKELMNFGG